ncbi:MULTISPECIES: helix-turn-helix domain-containing protein [unclassified Paracoccus (in: a-proteobacteria)]|jgi:DNA-binding HxlR family transcriptional regulator|uniref:winged helix-turn-helix transcriptional regulator n=1 Tax=unclassified Paracoccus (in: a-proteobacteria) TaxID=2688777 RepID=UPI000E6C4FA1|nr:helix-turn-helix domain-containing protein [Paracoccus sp. JM45]RJE78499.1 transcriptional regulator [Paracoccus sp. JM45]
MTNDLLRQDLLNVSETDPAVDRLVEQTIGRVADKWTMLLIEILTERECCRFSELSKACEGISQKMLTQTLRALECDGLVTRTVYPVVPPKVEYRLTDLGLGLSKAFCGVWIWAEENLEKIELARNEYVERKKNDGTAR